MINSPFCQIKSSAKRQCHTILYNLLIECNDSFIMIIIVIRSVHQIVWLHPNQTKLPAKYNNCILLPQVVVNCTASCSTVCDCMIRKLHKIAPLRTHIYIYIYNTNNLILYEVVNPTLVRSNFTLKTSSFWFNTKLKFKTSLTFPSHTLTFLSWHSLTLSKHN